MQKLFYAIAVFGAIAVGVINASLLWILFLALFNLNGILLNPVIFGRMQNQINDRELSEVAKTLISTYAYGVFMLSLVYGVGRLIGWLIY